MVRVPLFLAFLCAACLLLGLLFYRGGQAQASARRESIPPRQELVRKLGLTDLSLWSEARYTRHPSQADLFTAFQDYPGAFDHFPAGSIVGPGPLGYTTSLRMQKKGRPIGD